MPLTDKYIKSIVPADKITRHHDGSGLYLEVSPKGGKWWRLKYFIDRKEKRISLGTYPLVSLKEVREKAFETKKIISQGVDPSAQRQQEQREAAQTFEAVAREWLATQKKVIVSKAYQHNVRRLEMHVFPLIGNTGLKEVAPPDILAVCRRVEKIAIYSAHIVLSLCSRIFRYSVACGYVESDPCRDLIGALQPHKTKSRPAFTNPNDIRKLLLAIDTYNGNFITLCALKLGVLLFVRPGELRHAEWGEFDLARAEWRIPAEKMKMRHEHLVPLSRQSIEIITELRQVTGHAPYLFPSRRALDRPMSDNTILSALRYMGFERDQIVGHGFRAMASTMLNERGWSPDAIERQLAHAERNSVRAAYNRASYMEERRKMMQAWADFLDDLREKMP